MNISLAKRLTPDWVAGVELVRAKYGDAFGADVFPDPDVFILARDGDGQAGKADSGLVACAGLTFPAQQGLFSERYLEAPMEEAIQRALGTRADRRRIVEVGPLASCGTQAGLELIRLTPIIAWCLGMHHILCTVTARLERTLGRVGITSTPLASASLDRLPAQDRAKWGTYYDDDPRTLVIPLDSIGDLFTHCTGRYTFLDLQVALSGEELPDHAVR